MHVVGRIMNELLQSPNAIIIWFHIHSLTFTDIVCILCLKERLIGRKKALYRMIKRENTVLKTRACICNKLFCANNIYLCVS